MIVTCLSNGQTCKTQVNLNKIICAVVLRIISCLVCCYNLNSKYFNFSFCSFIQITWWWHWFVLMKGKYASVNWVEPRFILGWIYLWISNSIIMKSICFLILKIISYLVCYCQLNSKNFISTKKTFEDRLSTKIKTI